jgi:hypothetical protein
MMKQMRDIKDAKKEKSGVKRWVGKVFFREVDKILPFPFLDFTVEFINAAKKTNKLVYIRFRPDNYSASIFVSSNRLWYLWRKKKRVLREAIIEEMVSLYMDRLRILLADENRGKEQVREVIGELNSNIAFLLKNIIYQKKEDYEKEN